MGRPSPLLESRPRMTRLRSALAVPLATLLVLAPILGGSTLAAALPAEGSVPSEVAAYVADGSLVAQLDDVYGVGAGGDGIEFDETTTTGVIERVHQYSAELIAGKDTDHPLDLLNEWVVPISIAEEPVGLATIWINPASVRPELASFDADADLATALSAVPDGSSLVHDRVNAAWFALDADGILTPLVPGMTELSTPVPIDDIATLPPQGGTSTGEPAAGDPATGVGFAIAVILLLLAIIIVALVLPSLRKKKPGDADDAELEDGAEHGDEGEPAAESDADAEPVEVEPSHVAPSHVEPAVVDLGEVEAVVIDKPKKPRKPRKPAASTESAASTETPASTESSPSE